ncbi:isopenicillin N synthase family dioxygenase [Marinomonas foliarum]|uniref:2-oxoglutarate-dependent ethylene/succinate-forming enzyme n=1 Tax=Marinomonas foliarum TaxID=491950 RepID=A0ABX7ITQ1_9GAMM|nr:isopenicillin N synthase family oxygenase [Marinomonas foliarum]QRV25344.1 isopenicillin N synthase family oxygenase [Marinomonas foliarum]
MKSQNTTSTTLPIINLSGYQQASKNQKQELSAKIGEACREFGFFYITGHGIEESLQTRLFSESSKFFDLPSKNKLKIDKKFSKANRGYEPLKDQTLEAGTPPDLKEGFYIGFDHSPEHPMVKANKFNFGQNQWPTELPNLKPVAIDYLKTMTSLCEELMSLIALSLNLPDDYFHDFCHDPLATLRLLHYPPQPVNPEENEKGCGAHTDFGGLTLLLQDENGGLQVWSHKTDDWIDAPPIKGSYVVNIGDMIARWTNDQYSSTLHRVINKSGNERYSIPFFFSGHLDHEVKCIPTCLPENEQPKYPPTTVEKHMIEMYQKTYGDK